VSWSNHSGLSREGWNRMDQMEQQSADLGFSGAATAVPSLITQDRPTLSPEFLPILLMTFRLIRLRFANAYKERVIGYRHA
jgi:hypothetical protein